MEKLVFNGVEILPFGEDPRQYEEMFRMGDRLNVRGIVGYLQDKGLNPYLWGSAANGMRNYADIDLLVIDKDDVRSGFVSELNGIFKENGILVAGGQRFRIFGRDTGTYDVVDERFKLAPTNMLRRLLKPSDIDLSLISPDNLSDLVSISIA